jgi:hypothetical protein
MANDRTAALEALLTRTESAHGVYEADELNGVYDEAWPRWYAEYAVEHGIGELLGRPITADELARWLESSWRDSDPGDGSATESWASLTARRLLADS